MVRVSNDIPPGHLAPLGVLKATIFGSRLGPTAKSRYVRRSFGISKLHYDYLYSFCTRRFERVLMGITLLHMSNAHIRTSHLLASFRHSMNYAMKTGNSSYIEESFFTDCKEKFSPYHRFAGRMTMLTRDFVRDATHRWRKLSTRAKKERKDRRNGEVFSRTFSPSAVRKFREANDEFLEKFSQPLSEICSKPFACLQTPATNHRLAVRGRPLPVNFNPTVDRAGNVRNTYTGCYLANCNTLDCVKLEHQDVDTIHASIRVKWAYQYFDNVPHSISNSFGISERDIGRCIAYAERIGFPKRDICFRYLCSFLNLDLGFDEVDPKDPFAPKHRDEFFHQSGSRKKDYGEGNPHYKNTRR